MRALWAPLASTLLAAALAGCSAGPAHAGDPSAAGAPSSDTLSLPDGDRTGRDGAGEPQVVSQPFGWAASVAAAGVQLVGVHTTNGASLELEEGRSILSANVTWTCPLPGGCPLHVRLCSPDEMFANRQNATLFDRCALQAEGVGSARLDAAGPAPGEWVLIVTSDRPDVAVHGTIDLTAV